MNSTVTDLTFALLYKGPFQGSRRPACYANLEKSLYKIRMSISGCEYAHGPVEWITNMVEVLR